MFFFCEISDNIVDDSLVKKSVQGNCESDVNQLIFKIIKINRMYIFIFSVYGKGLIKNEGERYGGVMAGIPV